MNQNEIPRPEVYTVTLSVAPKAMKSLRKWVEEWGDDDVDIIRVVTLDENGTELAGVWNDWH